MLLAKVATSTTYVPVELPNGAPIEVIASESLGALATYYGLPEKDMRDTIVNESRWRIKAHNKQDPNGGSRGIAQFQDDTFYEYAGKLGVESPDVWNPIHQMEVMAYMWNLDPKLRYRWAGYKPTKPALSPSFLSDVPMKSR